MLCIFFWALPHRVDVEVPGSLPMAERRVRDLPRLAWLDVCIEHLSPKRRDSCCVLTRSLDRLVGKAAEIVGLPIVAETGRNAGIEHALNLRIRLWSDRVRKWRSELPDRPERAIAGVGIGCHARNQPKDPFSMYSGRQDGRGKGAAGNADQEDG